MFRPEQVFPSAQVPEQWVNIGIDSNIPLWIA
jgi:hypothetical protein